MALLSNSLSSSTTKMASLSPSPLSTSLNSSSALSSSNTVSLLPHLNCFKRVSAVNSTRGRRRSGIVGMAPEEEKLTRRSPLDFPIEWERPRPGRRPDVLPQFSPMKTPLPPPMPCDPPLEDEEDEDMEEEEREKQDGDQEEDPDKPAE